MIYANRLFVKMTESGDFPLTPRECTYFLGAVSPISAAMAIPLLQFVGRRKIFIWGKFWMSLFLFMTGLSTLNEWYTVAFTCIILYTVVFQMTDGSVSWLYVAEVAVDSATGFAFAGQFFNAILVAITFEYMINSVLSVHGSLWFYAILTFIGFILSVIFLRETRGLTDKEKKSLYTPKGTEAIDKLILELQSTGK